MIEEVTVDQLQDLNAMIAEVTVDQLQDLNAMIAEVTVDQLQDLNAMIAEAHMVKKVVNLLISKRNLSKNQQRNPLFNLNNFCH